MVEAWRLCCRLPRRSLDFTGDIRGKAQDKTILGDIEYPLSNPITLFVTHSSLKEIPRVVY